MIAGWPNTSVFILAFMFCINLLFTGFALISAALGARESASAAAIEGIAEAGLVFRRRCLWHGWQIPCSSAIAMEAPARPSRIGISIATAPPGEGSGARTAGTFTAVTSLWGTIGHPANAIGRLPARFALLFEVDAILAYVLYQ